MGSSSSKNTSDHSSIFEFDVQDKDNQTVSLRSFEGKKAYIVVNVASKWGLTKQNYTEFVEIYKKYSDAGLEILAFPCNNFGGQEPGTMSEIMEFVSKYNVTFPIFHKLECENGKKTHPLFLFLRNSIDNGIYMQTLKWNFTKFLCDSNGIPIKRYAPNANPLSMEEDIKNLLENGNL